MPIFEYECTECGERMEHLQLSSESPLKACPECGAEVRKLISAPAFQFKGSGWYVTDYANKDKSGQSAGDDKEKKPAGDGKAADSGSKSSDKSGSSDSSASSDKPDTSKISSTKTSSPAD